MMEHEIRDAVVKLEVKMEQMSESLATMAGAIEKLADVKYEIKELKNDMEMKYQRYLVDYHKVDAGMASINKDILAIAEKHRELETKASRPIWFVENASKLGWMLIASGIGFIVWIIELNLRG